MLPMFRKTLYDSRVLILWLVIGFAIYGATTGALYPLMIESTDAYSRIFETAPQVFSALFGTDAEAFDMANLGTFLHMYMMLWLLLIAGAVAIYQAFNAFTNAERDQSMDMLLSLPLSRRENLLGQCAATVATAFVSLLGAFLGFAMTIPLLGDIEHSILDIAISILAAIFPLLVIIAFSFLLTALVPSSRRFAGAIAYVFWLGSYMLFGFTLAIEGLHDLQPLFVYYYYNAGELMNHGIKLDYWLILLGVSALLLAVAWWRVDNKELGV